MNRKTKIFVAVLISLSALFTLSLLTSCSVDNTNPKESETTPESSKKLLTHPGQNLKDKVNSFKLGDREFDLSLDFDGFKKVLGDEMTVWYSKETVDNFNEEISEYIDFKYEYDGQLATYIVQNETYCGDLIFVYNDNSDKYEFFSLKTTFDYGDKEKFDTAKDISYTENGEIKEKDFPIEVDKICFSIDNLATGTTTREQLEQYLGNGEYTSDTAYSIEIFAFEDYYFAAHFDTNEVFKAAFIFPTNFGDYL